MVAVPSNPFPAHFPSFLFHSSPSLLLQLISVAFVGLPELSPPLLSSTLSIACIANFPEPTACHDLPIGWPRLIIESCNSIMQMSFYPAPSNELMWLRTSSEDRYSELIQVALSRWACIVKWAAWFNCRIVLDSSLSIRHSCRPSSNSSAPHHIFLVSSTTSPAVLHSTRWVARHDVCISFPLPTQQ